jgi:hypothetical protein
MRALWNWNTSALTKEKAAVKKHRNRVAADPTTPRLKVSKSATALDISLDHPDPALGLSLLAEALGTTNDDFLKGLLKQLAGSQGRGIDDDEGINFLLAMVTGFFRSPARTERAKVHGSADRR